MRGCCFGFRQLLSSSLCLYAALPAGCAAGGVSDAELAAARGDAADDEGSDATGSKDAGKGARSAAGGEGGDGGSKKDAATTSLSGSGGDSNAGRPSPSRADAGASSLPTIKCPSNLVCTADISVVLSALDPNVKADTAVCAQSGLLPMPVSCKSDTECKSARLTSAKCTGSYCIQACVK
jgi:hypothetical protein